MVIIIVSVSSVMAAGYLEALDDHGIFLWAEFFIERVFIRHKQDDAPVYVV